MSNKNILFIVEGENDEVKFLERLYSQCDITQKYGIYSYKTNIHVLSQLLYNEYPCFDDDEIDLRLVLKSKEDDEIKRQILSNKYTDIYLIFDFEPQHPVKHLDTVRRMLDYFDDSTDHGKLFLNYPMMQSYKDFPYLPDDDFQNRTVKFEDVSNYKDLVGRRSSYTDLDKIDNCLFVSLAVHHLKKYMFLINGRYEIPTNEDYEKFESKELFDEMCEYLEIRKETPVLNTSIFLMIDYNPTVFFNRIRTHKNDFSI